MKCGLLLDYQQTMSHIDSLLKFVLDEIGKN